MDDKRLRFAAAVLKLAAGRYAEAFPDYDLRQEVTGGRPKPVLPYPEWSGEDLAGKRLVVFPEQGFGDQIMFARFVPELRRRGAKVTLICAPALARLFEGIGDEVLAAAGQIEFPDPDYWTRSNSLLRLAGSPDDVPLAPYLPAEGRQVTRRRVGRIGVVTAGSPGHHNDANRSLPAALADTLLRLPGTVDLRPEATGATDFLDTAEIVRGLDLVITVDTAVAHLAGALGRPVWIMLPANLTDWRWLRGRDESPWYPTARLFRQATAGDWRPVLDRVISQALCYP